MWNYFAIVKDGRFTNYEHLNFSTFNFPLDLLHFTIPNLLHDIIIETIIMCPPTTYYNISLKVSNAIFGLIFISV